MKEIKINNIDLKIYKVDTLESVLINIATMLNTLPVYLKFRENISTLDELIKLKDSNRNIVVEDVLETIKNSGDKTAQLSDTISGMQFENITEDVIIPLICFF
jgi:hypothetical protein